MPTTILEDIRLADGTPAAITIRDGRIAAIGAPPPPSPGEERIDGKGYEMSVHLTHRDAQGRIAVVALPSSPGSANSIATWASGENASPMPKPATPHATSPIHAGSTGTRVNNIPKAPAAMISMPTTTSTVEPRVRIHRACSHEAAVHVNDAVVMARPPHTGASPRVVVRAKGTNASAE